MYIGITYPSWIKRQWHFSFWKRFMCKKHFHLFDEVLSSDIDGTNHYLHCDACGLEVPIDNIAMTNKEKQVKE